MRCFTPDGVFEFDGHVMQGHDALLQYADTHTHVMRARDITLNHLHEVRSNQANADAALFQSRASD